MLLINPIPGQEEENAEFLEKQNLALWLKKGENIGKKVQQILYGENIEKIKENISCFSNKNAGKVICNIIFGEN